jgi:hypothetical protein
MNPFLAAGIILAVILSVAAGGFFLWTGVERDSRPEMIEARVTLRNTCPVGDDAFVVAAPQSGRTARFVDGVAEILVAEGEPLRLRIAPGFDAVTYAGYDEPAARNVELIADCESSARQQMINRSMRESFGN